jgi:RNA polymerase sigma factor (sigma-70 family)
MADFLQIYEDHKEELYRFILGRTSDVPTAEDILSSVFIRIIRYEKDGGEITHIRGLLYRTARNLITDHYRGVKPTISVDVIGGWEDQDGDRAPIELVDTLPMPDQLMDIALTAEQIRTMLSRVKDASRELIELRFFQELSTEEIADILEVSEGAVRVRLHRAIKEVRELFPQDDKEQL